MTSVYSEIIQKKRKKINEPILRVFTETVQENINLNFKRISLFENWSNTSNPLNALQVMLSMRVYRDTVKKQR